MEPKARRKARRQVSRLGKRARATKGPREAAKAGVMYFTSSRVLAKTSPNGPRRCATALTHEVTKVKAANRIPMNLPKRAVVFLALMRSAECLNPAQECNANILVGGKAKTYARCCVGFVAGNGTRISNLGRSNGFLATGVHHQLGLRLSRGAACLRACCLTLCGWRTSSARSV